MRRSQPGVIVILLAVAFATVGAVGVAIESSGNAPATSTSMASAANTATAIPATPTSTVTPIPPTPTATATLEPIATESALPTAVKPEIPATETPAPSVDVAESPSPVATDVDLPVGGGDWSGAVQTPDGAFMGAVTSVELNIRSGPNIEASIVGSSWQRHLVTVYELIVNDDGSRWYRIGDDRYVSAELVVPFHAPAVTQAFEGQWVDINLSSFYAIAYEGNTPVYAAIITAGRDDKTPRGTFNIFYRVRHETMDSATVGIPKGDPEYYYLENVEYTQYFKEGGFALHGNFWTAPNEFGAFTSNGCIGLLNTDAGWFWSFLSEGSVVDIHD